MAYKDSHFYTLTHESILKNVLLQPSNLKLGKKMKVIQDIYSARALVQTVRGGKTIGLVPTMGALHEGHLSLVQASVEENDLTIATIFVNPLQFNNQDDLAAYPVSLNEDKAKLSEAGCDFVFVPGKNDMYSEPPVTSFGFGHLESTMEGAFRPGHFSGVALVVMKLFNILQPARAYFGQKDLQQFKIIEKMVTDTSMSINLKMMPIIREESGLALSSRNRRLSDADLKVAPEIYRALVQGVEALKNGCSVIEALEIADHNLQNHPLIKKEYLHFVSLKDLQIIESDNEKDGLALCFAGYIGSIRLIDNIIID